MDRYDPALTPESRGPGTRQGTPRTAKRPSTDAAGSRSAASASGRPSSASGVAASLPPACPRSRPIPDTTPKVTITDNYGRPRSTYGTGCRCKRNSRPCLISTRADPAYPSRHVEAEPSPGGPDPWRPVGRVPVMMAGLVRGTSARNALGRLPPRRSDLPGSPRRTTYLTCRRCWPGGP
jgi:hypothetical protein